MRRIVAKSDVGQLIEGLQRLRVVGINLDEHEDPQQIFESLNATGRPLTESEKVKNWLLMGLPDAEQQDLHDNYWLVMERALGAEHGSEPTDIFLRDLLRWRTGELVGIDRVYENLRRWLGRIRRRRNTRVGVPSDEEVQHGIRTRKAYGGSGTGSSFAVLCALMEAEHREESPARERLTVEHVMPQKLTDEWKHALGREAGETHQRHCHRLANLTLSGDVTNSLLGTATFDKKCEMYRKSTIGLTRRLAEETEWNQEALLRRADDLGRRALKLWPWPDQETPEAERSTANEGLKWRIEDGPWHAEHIASRTLAVRPRRRPEGVRRTHHSNATLLTDDRQPNGRPGNHPLFNAPSRSTNSRLPLEFIARPSDSIA